MINNYSQKEIEIINEFQNNYPYKSAKDLKSEIEKISDMLVKNQDSNRYTYRLQETAAKDNVLNKIRNIIPSSVNFLDYKNNKLKAQVNYLNKNEEYTIIMYMDIVARGRVFLKKYKTMKRILVKEGF